MSTALNIEVTVGGASEAERALQDFRNALASRGPMHARMAVRGQQFTQDYLRGLKRHRSAEMLGATPSGHMERSAAAVEARSDEETAMVVIPRRTGLGRAFSDVTLLPGSGRKFLTIPAHQTTYNRVARDFPEGMLKLAVIKSWKTFLALVFTTGTHKGEVAFWLRRSVKQKQDRSLLPSDDAYREIARRSAIEYLTNLLENPNGPRGGTSSGMPSAYP